MARPRVPTALNILRGNPGHRPINGAEPKLPADPPLEPTNALDEEGLKEWRRLVPILVTAGLATPVDRAGLTGYCELWSRWIELDRLVRRDGMVIMRKGIPTPNRTVRVWLEVFGQLRTILGDFGLTPASRSRIRVDPPTPKTKIDLFREKHGF